MDWTVIGSTLCASVVGLFGLVLGSVLTLVGVWLKSWLDKRFEFRYRRREASTAVAEILSEWIRSSYVGEVSNEDLWRLQTTYWKNVLWLDKDLVVLLAPTLARHKEAPTNDELIRQARKVLLGLKDPDIGVADLIHWDPKPLVFAEEKHERLSELVQSLGNSVEQLPLFQQDEADLRALIKTIEAQMSRSTPSRTVIIESLGSIRRILEKLSASVAAQALLQRITDLLGG